MYPDDLKDYVVQMARATPDMLEALKNTVRNPDKVA